MRRTCIPVQPTRGLFVIKELYRFSSCTSSAAVRWRLRSVGPLGGPAVAQRCVQYEHTSETLLGVNKGRRPMMSRWVTRSTKDYMAEADRVQPSAVGAFSTKREQLQANSSRRKERCKQITEETDRVFDVEMDRMREDSSRRWKKSLDFFKRQGVAFTLLYVATYFGCLLALYIGFASGVLKKEAAFEFMFMFLGKYINRDNFYRRVEAWDTYVNFGFAFVINEMVEVLRFPFVVITFYQLRPLLTGVNRFVKGSIFRFGAAES